VGDNGRFLHLNFKKSIINYIAVSIANFALFSIIPKHETGQNQPVLMTSYRIISVANG